jgi:hypothetical protein
VSKKALTFLGLALILAGALALAYQGISYTRREQVLDVGPLKATVNTRETIPLPPWLGGLLLAGGVASLVMGIRKSEP